MFNLCNICLQGISGAENAACTRAYQRFVHPPSLLDQGCNLQLQNEGAISQPGCKAPLVLPDIVGVGILVSFLVTCGAVFLIMLLGYFKDTLPGDNLTWADWAFLSRWHWCKACRLRFGAKSSTSTLDRQCIHMDPFVDHRRRKSLEKIVLTLSDQQLVTGPAMIVAALVQHCQLSCYEFQVVSSVAYLAATTHLTTLTILRQYFRENKRARDLRAIGMSLNLVLLSYCLVISTASYGVDGSASVQCIMSNLPSTGANAFIAIAFLAVNYAQSFAQLYNQNTPPLKNWLRKYCCTSPRGPHLDEDGFERWYEHEIIQSISRPGSSARREFYWMRAVPLGQASLKERLRLSLATFIALVADYQDGFLSEIPELLMSASYGVTQVVQSRQSRPRISNSENVVDFGQIVPLLMLLLPIMTAIDTYNESHPDGILPNHIQGRLEHLGPGLKTQIQNIPGPAFEAGTQLSKRKWHSIPRYAPAGCKTIASGLAVLDDAPRSIALDPNILSPYSRKDVQISLDLMFWINVTFSVATGALLWTSGLAGLPWTIFQGFTLSIQGVGYGKWAWESFVKARSLKHEHDEPEIHWEREYWMAHAAGTRAPPPSIHEDRPPRHRFELGDDWY
ncbi:uncharacterized protein PAC_11487 [Phialocephala subalpina]|uniref:Uncharacterized protein n=1 Tax=Phialocephala subalpina TaxID=576137 RepID=A0A1L7X997_9HELO|nr:uncharacterized protein PAC_11487 [Phialocephala subalpina]